MMRLLREKLCMSVISVFVLSLGCSTSNTENWKITSPTAGQLFEPGDVPFQISVSGTANASYSSNYVAAIDIDRNIILSDTPLVTTAGGAAPNAWSTSLTLQQMPGGGTLGTNKAAICTGTPQPSLTGTAATKHARVDVNVKFNPLVMMPPTDPYRS